MFIFESLSNMFLRAVFFLFFCDISLSIAISVTVYNDARFDPFDTNDTLANLVSIMSVNACFCQCYNNSVCLTANYVLANQTCSLYSAQLSEGWLRLVPTSTNAQVFSFRSIVCK